MKNSSIKKGKNTKRGWEALAKQEKKKRQKKNGPGKCNKSGKIL